MVGDNSSESPDNQELDDIPLSLDAILDILANPRRRALLEYLWEQPGNVGTVEEATRHILLKESRKVGEQPSHDAIQSSLLHHQLPKMADSGLVEYDVRNQTIRYHENKRLETAYERVQDLD